jgi:hypothetical protein
MLWRNVLSAASGEKKKKMEATDSSTALVPIYQNVRHHITEIYLMKGTYMQL